MSIKQAQLTVNAYKHNYQIHFARTGMFMLYNMTTTTPSFILILVFLLLLLLLFLLCSCLSYSFPPLPHSNLMRTPLPYITGLVFLLLLFLLCSCLSYSFPPLPHSNLVRTPHLLFSSSSSSLALLCHMAFRYYHTAHNSASSTTQHIGAGLTHASCSGK